MLKPEVWCSFTVCNPISLFAHWSHISSTWVKKKYLTQQQLSDVWNNHAVAPKGNSVPEILYNKNQQQKSTQCITELTNFFDSIGTSSFVNKLDNIIERQYFVRYGSTYFQFERHAWVYKLQILSRNKRLLLTVCMT